MRNAAGWLVIGLALLVACGPTTKAAIDASGGSSDAPGDGAPPIDVPPVPLGPVDVVITTDNAYSFGYGSSATITTFVQGQRAQSAGQIFNCPLGEGPEQYIVPEADAPPESYLYIVTWDDLSVTQGVIGQFSRLSSTVLTGDARFEVCATGLDYSTGPDALVGPSLAVINEQIALCNAGTGGATTTSKGWVNVDGAITAGAVGKLAVGETNEDGAGTFPIVCQPTATEAGVRSDAHWMWYDPVDGQAGDAFHSVGSNRFKAFLIFRLGAGSIIF